MDDQTTMTTQQSDCGNYKGALPQCAPLAVSYVPMQGSNPPAYQSGEALTRGTLFPGLDLPFMNTVNTSNPYAGTPLGELMALQFIVKELQLYLDTHSGDADAFKALQSTLRLCEEGRKKYVQLYGPVTMSDLTACQSYTWISDPWPWDYAERTGKS